MATALATGLIRQKVCKPDEIYASDVSQPAKQSFKSATGSNVEESNEQVAEHCETVVLAVKPQHLHDLLAAMGSLLEGKLVISIAAGVSLRQMESLVPESARLIRVMPNTPALVGAGISAFCVGTRATDADIKIARLLLGAVGETQQVPESWMDAVTGLSGSGPAYIYTVIESLADGGVAVGLPREIALKLAAHTVLGAAKMVIDTNLHPSVLRDAVASPAGTTIEGIRTLENYKIRSAFIEAVQAATARSEQLGKTPS